jgi:hypothetical protein
MQPTPLISPAEIQRMEAGRELDELVGTAFGLPTTDKWHILNSVSGGTYISFDRKCEADKYLAEAKQERPDGMIAQEGKVELVRSWPRASSDITAAWQVVEALERRAQLVDITRRKDFDTGLYPWECEIWNTSGAPDSSAIADTAPLAICRAALKANFDLLDAAAPLPTNREGASRE